jgi:selenium-binding protein 1
MATLANNERLGPESYGRLRLRTALLAGAAFAVFVGGLTSAAIADETCLSPYMPKITGHEDYVYVWTLGVEGVGDGSDKFVTIDVRDGSTTFGQVIDTDSVGSRNEAHHGGFTDDRRQFWATGLDTSQIFIFDVASDPSNPRLVKTITDFAEKTGGVVGPHGAYALPGRMMIPALSNSDGSGRTAIVEYSNDGEYITTHWIPTAAEAGDLPGGEFADGYGYDVRVLPHKNVMLTSSFTGRDNYMRPFGEVAGDPEAMQHMGNSMVLWDFHTRTPRKVFEVPGVPLEVRWAWGEDTAHAFTATALTSQLWLVYQDEGGEWQAKAVADIGDPANMPLPVDLSLSSDNSTVFVSTFGDGMTRVYDVSDPHAPKQIYETRIGAQVNMVSQSWDGERVYYTSSLLANWDKSGDADEQFLKAYHWNGSELTPRFEIDFYEAELGRPHMMAFGADSLYLN